MAVLTNSDFTEIKNIASRPAYKDVFKAWGLDKATWKALFQEMEDYYVFAFQATPLTSWKMALDAIDSGITNAQAKAIADVWGVWRINHQ